MAYLTDQIDNSRMHYSFFFFLLDLRPSTQTLHGGAQASLVPARELLLFWTVASLVALWHV